MFGCEIPVGVFPREREREKKRELWGFFVIIMHCFLLAWLGIFIRVASEAVIVGACYVGLDVWKGDRGDTEGIGERCDGMRIDVQICKRQK